MSADKPKPIAFGVRKLSDVTLIVESQEFRVHRSKLAKSSDVFERMLCGHFKEANQDRVEIKDVPVSAFQHLMEIVYHGKIKGCAELFPGHCYSDETGPNLEIEAIFCHDSGLRHLLEAADQFNMTKKVVNAIKDGFNQLKMPCQDDNGLWGIRENHCQLCISIYLILLDRDGTIKVKRTFDRSVMAEVAGDIIRLTNKLIPMDDAKLQNVINLLEQVEDIEDDYY